MGVKMAGPDGVSTKPVSAPAAARPTDPSAASAPRKPAKKPAQGSLAKLDQLVRDDAALYKRVQGESSVGRAILEEQKYRKKKNNELVFEPIEHPPQVDDFIAGRPQKPDDTRSAFNHEMKNLVYYRTGKKLYQDVKDDLRARVGETGMSVEDAGRSLLNLMGDDFEAVVTKAVRDLKLERVRRALQASAANVETRAAAFMEKIDKLRSGESPSAANFYEITVINIASHFPYSDDALKDAIRNNPKYRDIMKLAAKECFERTDTDRLTELRRLATVCEEPWVVRDFFDAAKQYAIDDKNFQAAEAIGLLKEQINALYLTTGGGTIGAGSAPL